MTSQGQGTERCRHGMLVATCAYCNRPMATSTSKGASASRPAATGRERTYNRLEEYVPAARRRLIQLAKQRKTITYGEIMNEFGGRGYIGKVLDEVNRYEHSNRRPLLSALVVRKETGRPGDGFWSLVSELQPSASHQGYWEAERDRVWNFDWSKHE